MKSKKMKIISIVLVNIFIIIIMFKAFTYDKDAVGVSKHNEICENYNLNLNNPEIKTDGSWKYEKCSRLSLTKDCYYIIGDSFVKMFDDNGNYTYVGLYLTDNKNTFNRMTPFNNHFINHITEKQNVYYRSFNIELQLVQYGGDHQPYCLMEFEYKNKYYKVVFKTTHREQLQFYASDNKINQELLDIYLSFLGKMIK